jgi:hypothetical protein
MIPADVLAFCRNLDEITLMERLEVSSEDLIERFEDRIIERLDEFEWDAQAEQELEEDDESNDWAD